MYMLLKSNVSIPKGCRSLSILPSQMGAHGVSLEHVENMENPEKMENMEMFSGSPTEMFSISPTELFSGSPTEMSSVLRFSENRFPTEISRHSIHQNHNICA